MTTPRPARVGLLAPMPSEMKPLAKACGLTRDEAARQYRGSLGGIELVGARTGMGTQNAADATERLLDSGEFNHVMVVGIAGGMGPSKVGAVLFPEIVVDKDSGIEYRAEPLRGIEPRGKLVTHDDFDMGDEEHQRLVREGFLAVDMETAAVARVCDKRGVQWSAVRSISDLVGVTPGDVIDLANPDGTPNIKASLSYLVKHPNRIPKLARLARESTHAANNAALAAAIALQ
jgi:adenosylhomocysteine nucleosidase